MNGQTVTYNVTADGLRYYDIIVGTGTTAVATHQADVSFVGTLNDGTAFQGGTGEFTYTVLATPEQVIPGFDEGVAGMKAGGVRRVEIPASLAYGSTGHGVIPPNTTLTFELTLNAAN